jgi:organic hydroperoxide reductase OsmC/OhrA
MSEHRVTVSWQLRSGDDFLRGKYSREHTWVFDGGVRVPASPSPLVVPAPFSNASHVDPEEAFVASVSSCHMLTFLYLAAQRGFAVERYEDDAIGTMTRNEKRVPWISSIVLHPRITYAGDKTPGSADEQRLHHDSHDQCFIANSIKTDVTVQPRQ